MFLDSIQAIVVFGYCKFLQALPGGEETDFIMVGCAGVQQDILPDPQLLKQTESKRRGKRKPCLN